MMNRLCGWIVGVVVCAPVMGGSVTRAYRFTQTDAIIKSQTGGMSDPHFDESMLIGPFEVVSSSSASLGNSFAFASSQQQSDVAPARFEFVADADTGGFAGSSDGGEGTPFPDFVAAYADSLMDVEFTVTAPEDWRIDADAFGFDDGYVIVQLVKVGADGTALVIFSMDTRLGMTSLHQSMTLDPGDYYYAAQVWSEFGPSAIGGFWAVDAVLEEQPSTACPGDANGDRVVDFLDLNIVLSFFGQSVAAGTSGDLNSDGIVDFLDLNIVLSFFGVTC